MPGIRDQHTGCVGAYLVEHDLFDFMLFSLPDNDAWSHKNGPHAQVTSIAAADRQLERLMHAAGGPDAFLDEHAVIVTSDHSQAAVEERIRLDRAFAEFDVATPSASRSVGAEVALSPAQRAAMVYALDLDRRDELVERSVEAVREARRGRPGAVAAGPDGEEAVVRSRRGELRFAPGAIRSSTIAAGAGDIEGDLAALLGEVQDGRFLCSEYPGRARPDLVGAELPDRRRRSAVGRARLRVRRLGRRRPRRRREPRLAAPLRLARGAAVVRHRARVQRPSRALWSLRDVAPMVREHFGISDGDSRLEEPANPG